VRSAGFWESSQTRFPPAGLAFFFCGYKIFSGRIYKHKNTDTMRVILLNKNEFKGKDGREWTKATYVSERGEVGEIFVGKTAFDAFDLSEDRFATEEAIGKLFESVAPTNVSFDNKGRVEKVE